LKGGQAAVNTKVLDSEASVASPVAAPVATLAQEPPRPLRQSAIFSDMPDPSVHFLVDNPQRHTGFRSWFGLAFFAGLLVGLAIWAIMSGF
jgi:hypothetical protein